MNDQFQIKVIDSLEDLAAIAGPWNKLLTQSMSDTVFLSHEWLLSWAETYIDMNKKLFVLTIYDNNELVGIAPFYIRNATLGLAVLKQIEFLGTPDAGSDYLDVIIKKGWEKEVSYALYDFLLKDSSSIWDCFALRDIPSNSLFLLHILNRIEEEDGKYVEIRQGSFCPTVPLPKTVEEYSSMLSSHRRQQFKRHYKVLAKQGELHHLTHIGKDISGPLNDFFHLYSASRDVIEPKHRLFLEKFAQRSESSVRVDFLTSAEKKIAGLLLLDYRNTLSMYLMGIDKGFNPQISIGNILVGLGIYKAIEDGMSTYDFLKGCEHYKFHWANQGRRSLNVNFSQKKIVPLLSDISRMMKYTTKMVLR